MFVSNRLQQFYSDILNYWVRSLRPGRVCTPASIKHEPAVCTCWRACPSPNRNHRAFRDLLKVTERQLDSSRFASHVCPRVQGGFRYYDTKWALSSHCLTKADPFPPEGGRGGLGRAAISPIKIPGICIGDLRFSSEARWSPRVCQERSECICSKSGRGTLARESLIRGVAVQDTCRCWLGALQ